MSSSVADTIPELLPKVRAAKEKIENIGLGRWAFEVWRRRVTLPLMQRPHIPLADSDALLASFDGKRGLEVGGPSRFFQPGSHLPLYPRIAALDNCNFAGETVWEGTLAEGAFQLGGRVVGKQIICEATAVASRFAGHAYDFVISSNCLEHVANPLAAIESWLAVLRPGGTLLVVVPNPASNFDHRRPVTTFAHVLSDYENGIGEDDTTHFAEVLETTDLRLTSKEHIADAAAFRTIVSRNFDHRCVHHHVFDAALLARIGAHFGLEAVRTIDAATEFVLLARKPAD